MGLLLRGVVVGSLLAALSCGDGSHGDGTPASGYGRELKASFVDDCAAAGTDREACACLYDQLEAHVPFARFQQLDRQLRAGRDDVPEDIQALAVACAADPEWGSAGG